MRLVKIVNGQVVQTLAANSVAYESNGTTYTLTISASGPTLTVQLRNGSTGLLDANFSVTDSTSPLNGTGLALYSANNPGGFYNLLAAEFVGTPPPTNAVVEVLTAGTGTGTISSNPGGIVLPGSPAATYTTGQTITLTPTPTTSLNSTFSGWSGSLIDPATGQIANLPAGLTTVTATWGGTPIPAMNLDVDGNTQISALTDGVLLVRYLFGVRGAALTQGAVAANANSARDEAFEIEPFIGTYTQVTTTQSASTATVSSAAVLSPQPVALSSHSALPAEPSAPSSSDNSTFTIAHSTFDDAASSSTIAATQLSRASVQSAPWVAGFLGTQQEEDELFVTLLA
jgi:hypothetical protein